MEVVNFLKEKVLVTGSVGFIGMHVCKDLLDEGYEVIGLDNINDYYDQNLKKDRLKLLDAYDSFTFVKLDIYNFKKLLEIFDQFHPDKIINLAGQAGVRYSIENPKEYVNSNIVGFFNLLECAKIYNVKGLIYASSSSVYGGNEKIPFSVKDRIEKPLSVYAVSKITNELLAKTYFYIHGVRSTGLRFFTVYGPWGRPDMAMYIFAKNILEGGGIKLFNEGNMERDFTYIEDIVSGIKLALEKNYQCEIFNLGNNKSENIMDIITILEKLLHRKANIILDKMQLGDVKSTHADIDYSKEKLGYEPKTSIKQGIPKFIDWFLKYHDNS